MSWQLCKWNNFSRVALGLYLVVTQLPNSSRLIESTLTSKMPQFSFREPVVHDIVTETSSGEIVRENSTEIQCASENDVIIFKFRVMGNQEAVDILSTFLRCMLF